ncbi:unnamed protein product [Somion occarium]|uniref:Sister chromatid cohesion protein n=2 Tax=Somion occarium TaxID=3059160 RepID=A0ABP1E1J2_9APHY
MQNGHWVPHMQSHGRRNNYPNGANAPMAVSSLQDAQDLLSMYPMASATPSAHVTRHLSNLSLTAAPPSYYIQPVMQRAHVHTYPQAYPQSYGDYYNELHQLNSLSQSSNDSVFFDTSMTNAVRYLGDQGSHYASYDIPQQQWSPQAQSSTYQSTPFAQSVFQHVTPSSFYPTPPPPGISTSSSSLASALGPPPKPQQKPPQRPPPKPPKPVYQPSESAEFFDNFLAEQTAKTQRRVTPPQTLRMLQDDSPDPLAFSPVTARTSTATPRKRKAAQVLESPTIKRIHTPSGSLQSSLSTDRHEKTPIAKRKQVFVELPPVPRSIQGMSTPRRDRSSSQTVSRNGIESDSDDLGGYGTDSPTRNRLFDHVKSSGRRATGERDERAPLEKLTTLLEDIFEAEDSLAPDIDTSELPLDFFSPHTTDCSRPLLHSAIVRKLTSHIGKAIRPSKRLRLSSRDGNPNVGGTPRSRGRIADIETNVLSRILRILERSVRVGEDLDPFQTDRIIATPAESSTPSKSKGKRKADRPRSKSKTPKPGEADGDGDANMNDDSIPEGPAIDINLISNTLEIARESILAADCCIALLSSDRLNKQLYSEELITACLATIKNQLMKMIYPFVEASSDIFGHISPILQQLVRIPSPQHEPLRRHLTEIFNAISSVIPRINDLISSDYTAMSESIIIQAVYIAIGPFFMVESGGNSKDKASAVVLSTLSVSAVRGLRLEALSLIRSIFGNHEDQRSWIIEEILSSLIKHSESKQKVGHFRLRDGRSIRTVSALLLQLVQTSAHSVRLEAEDIRRSRTQASTLRREDSFKDASDGPLLDKTDMEEIRLYISGLESATKAAKTIILFLTQRSGKTKTTKNSNEAEYRAIFDNLISDLLTVLFWPEWPAAALLLSIACKFMVASLDDIKTANDNNAAKTMALDHLGVIAARLRSCSVKSASQKPSSNSIRLQPLDEILSGLNLENLGLLASAHQGICSFLTRRSSEDQACASARELSAVVWGQELAFVLKQCGEQLEDADGDRPLSKGDYRQLQSFGARVKQTLRTLWKDSTPDVFDAGSEEEAMKVDRLSEEVGMTQSLKGCFNPVLNVVLSALDAPPVFMRTKALKALGQIVMSDPSILSTHTVRQAIESHLLDSSPAVRDAAVELIGKYMIDTPEVAGDYYPKIADRIADTGLGVRKRVIKLLKSFYSVTEDSNRRIDISTRLVLRMLDEDDTVKDFAVKTVEEMWFHDGNATIATHKGKSPVRPHEKSDLLAKVTVIMGVAANFKDRQSPVEDLLHQIMDGKDANEMSLLHSRYAEICQTLIDGLVDASDLPGFTVHNCVRTIHIFVAAYPAVLSTSNALTLLPYLKNATSPEEQAITDCLLRVYRASIPYLPKTATKFGQELQLALQPMVLKPPSTAGILGLQEIVACMCSVVQHLTHDYGRLTALLKSCNARLQQSLAQPTQKLSAPQIRTLSILIFIAALLCEHCNFDDLRNGPHGADIDAVSPGSVTEHVYGVLLKLYEKYPDKGMRSRVLQCMGFLFRAQPTLLTAEPSTIIMDSILASTDDEARARLLRILQEFLSAEAEKHAAKEKEKSKGRLPAGNVNMEELIGNTDGFAESGISSAIVQRYLDPILSAATSPNHQIQSPAVDVIAYTVRQGLAHPLQLFPVIVALETSPYPPLSARATALHSLLHSKHTSLLNSRFVVSARASFDYQKVLNPPVRGYRMTPAPTALMQQWYSLVREKRAQRQDFLKALVKVFDIELATSSQDDVDFARYMAENFATFDYKTQEEVLTVIKYLTAVLSTTGMQLVGVLSPQHLLAQLHDGNPPPQEGSVSIAAPSEPLQDATSNMSYARSSVIVAIIMILKAFLKTLYGVSEEKCSKFVVGKKSAIGDRPATRRHERPISWERIPFATAHLQTSQDVEVQKQTFLSVWSEDGLSAEPTDD